MPVAMLPRNNEISLLQMDGDMKPEEIKEALELGKKACSDIYEIQKKALKEKYK